MVEPLSSVLDATTSVVKALKEISKKELSGQLTIRFFNSHSTGWRVYIGRGKVHYASSLVANQERINYLLSHYFPDLNRHPMQDQEQEYDYLCSFWRSGKISLQDLRQVIYTLTQEALIHCFASPPVQLEFEESVGLDPILVSASVKKIAYSVRPQVLGWMKLREGISSPLWRVGTEQLNGFYNAIAQNSLSQQSNINSSLAQLKPLAQALTAFPNLYALAQEFKVDVLTLAQELQPYAEQKQLQIKPYEEPKAPNGETPVVACIDDSHTVQRNVKLTLETAGYEVISLTEPGRALTALARKKPVLILMDITMPDMNGYDLSRMLRKSASLAEVPIVMLTGRDGVVDRLRARMVGANDYITKPFNPHQLIQLVQALTRQPQPVEQ
ncbi:response regulator receiver protein [Halothece sp. PCC 7418]|uniref:response regulator n=1 Tax=Halothece sp. (strain PCC 7418) TaxID=65093 RepID=UPI0002A06773|nr:response regulator [Halothece sp. PCC 7418]AFZ43326.1 response regulator receiver protein [Halothece sp. PCC 7418]